MTKNIKSLCARIPLAFNNVERFSNCLLDTQNTSCVGLIRKSSVAVDKADEAISYSLMFIILIGWITRISSRNWSILLDGKLLVCVFNN